MCALINQTTSCTTHSQSNSKLHSGILTTYTKMVSNFFYVVRTLRITNNQHLVSVLSMQRFVETICSSSYLPTSSVHTTSIPSHSPSWADSVVRLDPLCVCILLVHDHLVIHYTLCIYMCNYVCMTSCSCTLLYFLSNLSLILSRLSPYLSSRFAMRNSHRNTSNSIKSDFNLSSLSLSLLP